MVLGLPVQLSRANSGRNEAKRQDKMEINMNQRWRREIALVAAAKVARGRNSGHYSGNLTP